MHLQFLLLTTLFIYSALHSISNFISSFTTGSLRCNNQHITQQQCTCIKHLMPQTIKFSPNLFRELSGWGPLRIVAGRTATCAISHILGEGLKARSFDIALWNYQVGINQSKPKAGCHSRMKQAGKNQAHAYLLFQVSLEPAPWFPTVHILLEGYDRRVSLR